MAQKRAVQSDQWEKMSDGEGRQQHCPKLSRVVVEAMRMNTVQKFWQAFEPLLRTVITEEIERVVAKCAPPNVLRCSPKQLESGSRNLRLQFRNKLSLPLFTGSKVEGEQGDALQIVLLDTHTMQRVTSGKEAFAKLDIVALEGDFSAADDEDWSPEEFCNHEVTEREGKRPLLAGDLTVSLKEGVGTLGEVAFTDNSSWNRSRKFRLGVKVTSGCCEDVRIREAKTEAFCVKDHRGELYKKHYPPALQDEVWRLEKIGKDGAYHKRLVQKNIWTVEHFLVALTIQPQKLREIFGSNISNKTWDAILDHARTCILGEKLQVFYPENNKDIGLIFNIIYQPLGVITNGHYVPMHSLSENDKVQMDKLLQLAYKSLDRIVSYSDTSNISIKLQNQKLAYSQREPSDSIVSCTSNVQKCSLQRKVDNSGKSHPICIKGSSERFEGVSGVYFQLPVPICQHSIPAQGNLDIFAPIYGNHDHLNLLASAGFMNNRMQNSEFSW